MSVAELFCRAHALRCVNLSIRVVGATVALCGLPATASGSDQPEKAASVELSESWASPEAESRLEELREAIAYHDHLYFVTNRPVISDYAYDQLKRELEALEAKLPGLAKPVEDAAPISGAAAETDGVVHGAPMLSLDKAYTRSDWDRFHRRISGAVAPDSPRYVIEPKYDGVAISLIYDSGKLVHAATRGNGLVGRDVTAQLRAFAAIPETLEAVPGGVAIPDWVELRGEVFVSLADFSAFNDAVGGDETPAYASPRSMAAGVLQRRDLARDFSITLAFAIFAIGHCEPASTRPESQLALHQSIRDWGLAGVAEYWIAETPAAAWTQIEAIGAMRSGWAFPNDGVVVKVDAHAHRAVLGSDQSAPRWAIACKFAPPRASTVLRSIDTQVGRTGRLTPVAVFDPVVLGGATIRRASLHNFHQVTLLGLHEGDTLVVELAGEVIPQVVEVDSTLRPADARIIQPPENCPSCGAALETSATLIRCPALRCPEQVRKRIAHFVSPQALDVPGLEPRTIDLLMQAGALQDVADIFLLDREDRRGLNDAGVSDPDALLAVIDERRTAPFDQFLIAMGIPGVGPATARKIAAIVPDFTALSAFPPEALSTSDLSTRTANSLIAFLGDPERQQVLAKLASAGVRPAPIIAKAPANLADKVFVFSGTLPALTRVQARSLAEEAGAQVRDSVSSTTSYLVAGEQPGRKLAEARRLGIPVIDQAAFLEMLGRGAPAAKDEPASTGANGL